MITRPCKEGNRAAVAMTDKTATIMMFFTVRAIVMIFTSGYYVMWVTATSCFQKSVQTPWYQGDDPEE